MVRDQSSQPQPQPQLQPSTAAPRSTSSPTKSFSSWPKALSRVEAAKRHLQSQKIFVPSSSSSHTQFLVCPHAAHETLRRPPTTSNGLSCVWHKPPTSNPVLQHALTNANGATWKRQRPIITQAFSRHPGGNGARDHAIHMAIHVALSRIMSATTENGHPVGELPHVYDVWNFITCQSFSHKRWIDARELALEVASKAMVVAVFGERGLDGNIVQKNDDDTSSVSLQDVDLNARDGGRREDDDEDDDDTTVVEEESVKLPDLIQDLFRESLQLIPKLLPSSSSSAPAPPTRNPMDNEFSAFKGNSWQIFHQAVESMIQDIDLELKGEVETGIFDEGLQDCLVVQLLRYELEEEKEDNDEEEDDNSHYEGAGEQTLNTTSSFGTNEHHPKPPQGMDESEDYDKDCEGTVATSLSEDLDDTIIFTSTQTAKTSSRGGGGYYPSAARSPKTFPRGSSAASFSRASKRRFKRRATESHYLYRQEVVGNAHSALLAGTQTIATTLTGALLHLAERPELQDQLQQSMETAKWHTDEEDGGESGSSSDDEDNSHTNEKRLTGKDVVLETLRILPPVAGLPRVPAVESGVDISIEGEKSNEGSEDHSPRVLNPSAAGSISIGCPRRHSMKGAVNMGDTMVIDTLAFAHAQPLDTNVGEGEHSSSSPKTTFSWMFDPFHKRESYSQPWGIGNRKCPAGLLSVECISQVLESLVDQRIRWEFATPVRDTVGATGKEGWIEDVAYQPTLSYLRPIPLIFERLPVPTTSD